MRAIAIVSVLCAHSSFIISDKIWDEINSKLLLLFGLVGVPIYFINSGYFYSNNKPSNYTNLIKKKLVKIFIPWLLLSSIVYLYIILRKGGGGLVNYIEFIIGIGNYTYFLSVLVIFYLMFLKVKFSNFIIVIGLSVSVISSFLTTMGYFDYIDPYINPLNWLVYFLLGVILKKYNLLLKLISILEPLKYYLLTLLSIFIVLIIRNDYYPYYWNPFAYIFIPFFIIVSLSFLKCQCRHSWQLIELGKLTLPIYLIHSLFIGGIVYFTNKLELGFLIPFRPFIVLSITLSSIILYSKIIHKLNIDRIGKILIGLPT